MSWKPAVIFAGMGKERGGGDGLPASRPQAWSQGQVTGLKTPRKMNAAASGLRPPPSAGPRAFPLTSAHPPSRTLSPPGKSPSLVLPPPWESQDAPPALGAGAAFFPAKGESCSLGQDKGWGRGEGVYDGPVFVFETVAFCSRSHSLTLLASPFSTKGAA